MLETTTKFLFEFINRYKSLFSWMFLSVILSYVLSRAIVNQNYNFLFFITIVYVGFLILKSNVLAISLILFLAFFGNWFEVLGIMPGQFNWLVEVITGALFIKALSLRILNGERIRLKYMGLFSLFASVVFLSLLFNLDRISILQALLFLRLLIRYYLLYLAVLNLDLDLKALRLIMRLLVILFIIQIPTSVIKLFIYGMGERAIGTYAYHGGGLSTVIPLIAISFCFAFYFFYKKSKTYLVLALSFVIFGVIGGKKAIIVFVPVLVFFIGFFLKGQSRNMMRYFLTGSLIVVFAFLISVRFIGKLNPSWHPGQKPVFQYLTEYFIEYEAAVSEDGRSMGRIATSKYIFNFLKAAGIKGLMVGYGPGSYIETRFLGFKENLKSSRDLLVTYGVTGLSWLALQVGYAGAFIYLALFYLLLRNFLRFFKAETNSVWKSFGFGMVGFSFVMLFINVVYAPMVMDDLVPLVYFLLSAFITKIESINSRARSVPAFAV